MSPAETNGHSQDIHDNVVYIRGSISNLEAAIEKLVTSVNQLTHSIESSTASTEKTIRYVMEANEKTVEHVKGAIPLKVVLVICSIIVVSFISGGALKELIDSHILTKLLTGV